MNETERERKGREAELSATAGVNVTSLAKAATMGGWLMVMASGFMLVLGLVTVIGATASSDADLMKSMPPETLAQIGNSASMVRAAYILVGSLVSCIGLIYIVLGLWARKGTSAGTLVASIANGVVLPFVFLNVLSSIRNPAFLLLTAPIFAVFCAVEVWLVRAWKQSRALETARLYQAWAGRQGGEAAPVPLARTEAVPLLKVMGGAAKLPGYVMAGESKPVQGYWPPSGLKE